MGRVEFDRFGLGSSLLSSTAQRGLGQSRVGEASCRGHGDEALRHLVVKVDAARPRTKRKGILFVFFEDYPSNSESLQHDKLEREWRSFQKEMWNPFVDRVDADSETLNGRSNRQQQLLDDNLKWQRRAEELANRHEQRISELEKNLEEKEVYISNIKCILADLSGRVLESVHTILTQPGTPVSFQGMFIYLLFDFRKLQIFQCFPFLENSRTPTFPISGNSGLRRFPRFLYYVILLVSCLHPSLVTPSAVGNTSLSPDLQ